MKQNRQGKRSIHHKSTLQEYIRDNYFESPDYLAATTGVTRGRVLQILKDLHLRPRDLQFRSSIARPPAQYSNR